MAGDRGGSTNSSKPTFNKVVSGNPEGRGGATFSKGIGPIGTYALGTKPSNPVATPPKTGMIKGNKAC